MIVSLARIMGVLNVTPDSFSDGGHYLSAKAALDHADRMLAEGADIIDVGGESTRPGASAVSSAEELRRVLPVVEALATRCTVSIDTRKPEVARRCVRAGARIINDVSASLEEVAADLGAGWVAMHKKGTPRTMQQHPEYDDVVQEVADYLQECARRARARGVEQIWIDPGIGFGKSLSHNLVLLRNLPRFVALRVPVLVGASRKTFLGEILQQPVPAERRIGSVAVAVLAAVAGVEMVRVHDVKETADALRVVNTILQSPVV
jgi:dihydropteroate synthase